jgi:hypothetical protein
MAQVQSPEAHPIILDKKLLPESPFFETSLQDNFQSNSTRNLPLLKALVS